MLCALPSVGMFRGFGKGLVRAKFEGLSSLFYLDGADGDIRGRQLAGHAIAQFEHVDHRELLRDVLLPRLHVNDALCPVRG